MLSEQRNKPLVSIVIATYITEKRFRIDELLKAIDSSMNQDYRPLEILVLDDGSEVDLKTVIKTLDIVKIIRSDTNIGVTKIKNLGFFLAKGKYVFSLDDDAFFLEDTTVSSVVSHFEKLPKVAAIALPIVSDDKYNDFKLKKKKSKIKDIVYIEVASFCGAGASLRRDVILNIGGYRELFYMQGEEEDLSIRLIDRGWSVITLNIPPIFHRESARRDWNPQHIYGPRNSILFIMLNVPFPFVIPRLFFNTLGLLYHGIRIKKLMPKINGILKGYYDGLRNLPDRNPVSLKSWKKYYRFLKQTEPYNPV